jgi:hypothetical protein
MAAKHSSTVPERDLENQNETMPRGCQGRSRVELSLAMGSTCQGPEESVSEDGHVAYKWRTCSGKCWLGGSALLLASDQSCWNWDGDFQLTEGGEDSSPEGVWDSTLAPQSWAVGALQAASEAVTRVVVCTFAWEVACGRSFCASWDHD